MRRVYVSLILLASLFMLSVPAAAYYDFIPYDPILTFEDLREVDREMVRADVHVHIGKSDAYWDAKGALHEFDNPKFDRSYIYATFIPIRLGWTFYSNWDASLVFNTYNYRDRMGGFFNGLADVWLTGKGMWNLNGDADSVRMGPRISFRFPVNPDEPTSGGSNAVDIGVMTYYKEKGKKFYVESQLGYRHDMAGDKYNRPPGPSIYIVAEPGFFIGKRDNFTMSVPIGTYFGVGLLSSHCFWTGVRARFNFDKNVALTLGGTIPLSGYSGELDGYTKITEQYYSGYIGLETYIPTRH